MRNDKKNVIQVYLQRQGIVNKILENTCAEQANMLVYRTE